MHLDHLDSRRTTRGGGAQAGGMNRGLLIINADDWGIDRQTTDLTLDCVTRGTVSSVSAMVFMEDSERAAAVAREHGVDAGLHINFTTSFSAPQRHSRLVDSQEDLGRYLRRHRFAQIMPHPGLMRKFEYVLKSQRDEFRRLYGAEPQRIDGHHHMHLCANVLLGRLLPPATVVRRNFSFRSGEKSLLNRFYRRCVDKTLLSRHRLADYLFNLAPLEPADRLRYIFSLAEDFAVEVETHPGNADEYQFLTSGEVLRLAGDVPISTGYSEALSR